MTRQKKQRIKGISKVTALVWGIISLILFTMLLLMNILPTKYMVIILGIYIPFFVVMFILLWLKKVKTKIKLSVNIIGIIIICIFSFGIFYMYKTMNFMDRIRSKDYQIEEYYILVRKDSVYEEITDIEDEKVGILPLDNNSYDKAIVELEKLVTIKYKEYQDIIEMSDALLDKDIDVIFIGLANKSIVEDLNKEFASKVKVLKTISIKIDNQVETKEVNVSKESFNVYISGIDVYGDISLVSRSDVNIIMTINPNTYQVLLTSIPRDYYVRLHGTTGYKDKLTHAGIYGVDMSVKTIEDILDININYYVRVNFTTLVSLVDAIGGIDIYSDTKFTTGGVTIEKGMNHMNGIKALTFARERHAYVEGDVHRGQNQQAVITAIMNKVLSSKTLITKYTSILKTLSNSFQTNMDSSKIYELVNMQLDKMPKWKFESINLNGTGSSDYTYSYKTAKLYVMEPDVNTIIYARNKINAIENATR